VRALVRRRGHGRGGIESLVLIAGAVMVGYNGFLLFSYLAVFQGWEAERAASYWRYNTHVGLIGVAVAVFAAAWAYSTVQSRRSLPAKYRLGWWLSPLATMALLTVALVAPTMAAATSADAVNRSLIDRDTLIADARVLGHTYERDGQTWVGNQTPEVEFDSRGVKRGAELFCQQSRLYGPTLVTVAMKYIPPTKRDAMQTQFADALAACARGELEWESLATEVWYQLLGFAASYDIGPYSVPTPHHAILVVLSLELALLGTVIVTIAELSSWRRLGRIALGLIVVYYIFQTIAPVAFAVREALFETVIRVTLMCAGAAMAGWSIAIVSGRLRHRSAFRDHLLNTLLAAPAFAAAMANSASGHPLSFFHHGWVMSTLPLPADEHLEGGFLIALGFLAVTPLLHVFVEHYRTFRET